MRTFAVGLWKEWRDHRAISIALVIALPVLALAAAWAFGGDVPKPSFGGMALFVVNVAQALYVLAVASESFGSERRRGTLDFVRRLPRGLPRTLAAKLGAYLVGTLLALAWGAAVAWLACVLFGPERAARDLGQMLLQPDPLTTTLALGLFVLGLWTLFTSNLVPQGGGATVGAALLVGLLGLPVWLALKDKPWLVKLPSHETIRLGLLGLGGLAVGALLAAFLMGCRFLGGIWGPAWRGLAVVFVVAGGGYAWGAVELHRALTIHPHDPEFRIFTDGSYLATGGRYLYLTVHRGADPWYGWPQQEGQPHGSPVQPWIVDLEDGSWRVAGEYMQAWVGVAWNNRKVPQPVLRRYDHRDVSHPAITWFQANPGVSVKTLPADVRTPDVLELERWAMPALAWHHDDRGRALWLEGERVVREGDGTPLERWFPGRAEAWQEPVAGGWRSSTVVWDDAHRTARSEMETVDALTGERRPIVVDGKRIHNELTLSTRTLLRRAFEETPRGKKARLLPWSLVDLAHGGALLPSVEPPEDEVLEQALPGERVLLLHGPDRSARLLSAWDPRTGTYEPIVDAEGKPFVGRALSVLAQAPGGLRVVQVLARYDSAGQEGSLLLMDDALGHAWRLPIHDLSSEVIAIDGPRSVVMLRRKQRVERYSLVKPSSGGHDVFELDVLFPR